MNTIRLSVLLLAAALLCSCSDGVPFPEPNRCGDPAVEVYREENHLFGSSVGQLSAGQISGSLATPDGTTVWVVNTARLHTSQGEVHLDNCLLVQDGSGTRVCHGGTEAAPQGLIPAPDATHRYSINDIVLHDGEYELLLTLHEITGPGPYDYENTGTAIARIDAAQMQPVAVEHRMAGSTVYGAAVLHDGDYTYIYGARNIGLTKELYVARVQTGSLTAPWEFFADGVWSWQPEEARPVTANVSDQCSVFGLDGVYYLVSQSSLFGQDVLLYQSGNPVSGWQLVRTLYCRSGDNTRMSANTIVHRLLDNGESLLCSFSVLDRDLYLGRVYAPQSVRITHWR